MVEISSERLLAAGNSDEREEFGKIKIRTLKTAGLRHRPFCNRMKRKSRF